MKRQIHFSIPQVFATKSLPVGESFKKTFEAQSGFYFSRMRNIVEALLNTKLPIDDGVFSNCDKVPKEFKVGNKAKQDFSFTIDLVEDGFNDASIILTSYDSEGNPFIIFEGQIYSLSWAPFAIPTFKTKRVKKQPKKEKIRKTLSLPKKVEPAVKKDEPVSQPLVEVSSDSLAKLIEDAKKEKLEKLCDPDFRSSNNALLSSLNQPLAFLEDLELIQAFIANYDKSLETLCEFLGLSTKVIYSILVGDYQKINLSAMKSASRMLKERPEENAPTPRVSQKTEGHFQTPRNSSSFLVENKDTFKTTKTTWTPTELQLSGLYEAQQKGKKLEAYLGYETVCALSPVQNWAIKACLTGDFGKFTSDKEVNSVVASLISLFDMYKQVMEK